MPDQDIIDQLHAAQQAKDVSAGDVVDQIHAAHSDYNDFRAKHPIITAIPDFLGGIGAGVIGTGVGAYDLARKIPGVDSVLPEPSADVRASTVPPDSFAGNAGKFLEQGAEFLLPAGAAVDAAKGLSIASKAPALTRIAAEALANAGTAAVQSGGDSTSALVAGGATGILGGLGAAIPAVTRATVSKLLSAAPSPLSQGALDLAKKYGIDLSQGALTGSKTAQGVEKILGTSVAPDLYEGMVAKGQSGLNQAARDLSGDFAVDKFAAGDSTAEALLQRAADLKNEATGHYQSMAQIEADPAYTKSVQVGTKQVPIQQLRGLPLNGLPTQSAPVMADLGLPVDMRPAKASLQPIKDEISRYMTPTQRRMDPGLSAIENIMSRPDAVSASTAEADLGYLKSILRSPGSPQSKRLAGMAVDALSGQIDEAVKGTPAEGILQQARGAWKNKSDIEELVGNLSGDKNASATNAIEKGHTNVVDRLLRPSDGNYPLLQKVLTAAPGAKDDLGKAALGQILKQAEDKPGFYNPTSAQNAFNQLGKRTKEALFDPDHLKDINSFFELAKRFNENPNPSGTGSINLLVKMGLMVTHPIQGGVAFGFGRPMAKVLYNPEGATALNAFLKAKNPQEQSIAASIINAIAAESGTANNQPPAISATITKPGN